MIQQEARARFIRQLPELQARLEAMSRQTTPRFEMQPGRTGRLRAVKVAGDPVALHATVTAIEYAMGKPDPRPQVQTVVVPIQIVFSQGRTATLATEAPTIQVVTPRAEPTP